MLRIIKICYTNNKQQNTQINTTWDYIKRRAGHSFVIYAWHSWYNKIKTSNWIAKNVKLNLNRIDLLKFAHHISLHKWIDLKLISNDWIIFWLGIRRCLSSNQETRPGHTTWDEGTELHNSKIQATGLDAWASRVKCPARFVSHLHDICIYMSCL